MYLNPKEDLFIVYCFSFILILYYMAFEIILNERYQIKKLLGTGLESRYSKTITSTAEVIWPCLLLAIVGDSYQIDRGEELFIYEVNWDIWYQQKPKKLG